MQAIDRKEAQRYLSTFEFRAFFTELMGWNAALASPFFKSVDLQQYRFTTIAEKKGYTVLLCDSIPPYPVRARLDRLISRDHFEHIIVFADHEAKRQVWQVSIREKGHPVKLREVPYRAGASGEELIQKLQQIAVPLEREEGTHLSDLTSAARAAFSERVTKKFFKQFEVEHKGFLKFLRGIPDTVKPWYVSVLINRLMFLYFMQSKSFLDGNQKYLTDKLTASKARKKDTFYRDFLCPLFFEGFALKQEVRSAPVKALLGDIPYLNGGLFQKHSIELAAEADGSTIVIPDAAFEQLFGFFDKWTWHLDPDETASGDEIDPDVLGYIFEKYINQKQMGAYYTKEDITGYIAQNTVIPFLFDTARKGCANAFEPSGAVWRMLSDDPNRYIYPAMRRGNEPKQRLELPTEIAAGLDEISKRDGWNRSIPAELEQFALPTETWREFVARRRRYDEIVARTSAGEVHEVNDLITLNLDIRQLALDAIQIAGSEDLVESFYKAIESVTILDPTCGSGAFLFAALELLQPLYEACLLRMREFVAEDEARQTASLLSSRNASASAPRFFPRHKHFRKTLEAADRHVNPEYFILKTIIVQNLYGVDIMEEATEICKLRLFLKLVAQLDTKDKDKIEPLPDIDFNIRAGNTLVGYARYDDVKKAAEAKLFDGKDAMIRIDDRLLTLDAAVAQFRRQQTELGGSVTVDDKATLNGLYKELEAELDDFLAAEYGVKKNALTKWKHDTKPFHWFCDFHSILQAGGFNVIVGNPPWKEYAAVKKQYTVVGYSTIPCGNLHGICTERALEIASAGGYVSLIVQLPLVNSARMSSVRTCLRRSSAYLLSIAFDDRPGKLFDGLQHCRSAIFIARTHSQGSALAEFASGYKRWPTKLRPQLFETLEFVESPTRDVYVDQFAKIGSQIASSIIEKSSQESFEALALRTSAQELTNFIFYQEATQYWVKATVGLPFYAKNKRIGPPAHGRYVRCRDSADAACLCSIMNSSLFYLHFIAFSDCFHLGDGLVSKFEVPASLIKDRQLKALADRLMTDLRARATRKTIETEAGDEISYDEFNVNQSKHIIDEIDRVLAKHYGFTDDELDFILNYDIKYRIGAGAEEVDLEVDA